MSRGEDGKSMQQEYEEAIAAVSKRMGCTPEELKARINENRKKLGEVTPDCLTLGEAKNYPLLSSNRLEHVAQCTFCTKVTELVIPKKGGTYE